MFIPLSPFSVSFCPCFLRFFYWENAQTLIQHVYKHSLFDTQNDRETRRHTAPFRTRAYNDIKGTLFSPSYRYSTGGLCCVHIYVSLPLCVYRHVCVKAQCMEWTLANTQGNQIVTWFCVCLRIVFFLCVINSDATAVPPTMLREAEQLFLWQRLFVVVWRQEMRSCWGLWLRARRAYRRATPGHEENTNHLLASLTGLMEMRNSSFNTVYRSKVEHGYTFSPLISIFLLLSLIDSNASISIFTPKE